MYWVNENWISPSKYSFIWQGWKTNIFKSSGSEKLTPSAVLDLQFTVFILAFCNRNCLCLLSTCISSDSFHKSTIAIPSDVVAMWVNCVNFANLCCKPLSDTSIVTCECCNLQSNRNFSKYMFNQRFISILILVLSNFKRNPPYVVLAWI